MIPMSPTLSTKRMRYITPIISGLAYSLLLIGCNDLVGSPPLPDGVQSPSTYNTPEGARKLTVATTVLMRRSLENYVIWSGLLTDEFSNARSGSQNPVDNRNLDENATTSVAGTNYRDLHKLRGQARFARGVVAKYAPNFSPAVRGHLYAVEAYSEILLSDLYCSGIPLSTLDFEGSFTYRPSSSRTQVYENAISLLDSAMSLADDSANVKTLISVSKGRALTAIGKYEEASEAVRSVANGDIYDVRISFYANGPTGAHAFAAQADVSDGEGQNGLHYISSGDPRTASDTISLIYSVTTRRVVPLPNKYHAPDSVQFTMADWIEARLIEAEAALHRDEPLIWLSTLNELRTTGMYTSIDTTFQIDTAETVIDTTVTRVDTLWAAGTGRVAGLRPLNDPGTFDSRVDLLFAERAAWLFATGRRQGDLRRLVSQYGRNSETVYPVGTYMNVGSSPTGMYGRYIDVPIPSEEHRNPLFKGCLNRD